MGRDKVANLDLKDPELLWDFIENITEFTLSEKVRSNLAAGPIESLLAHHGDKFIERVEKKANSHPPFKKLLGGVWQNLMSAEVWSRVQKAAGPSLNHTR